MVRLIRFIRDSVIECRRINADWKALQREERGY